MWCQYFLFLVHFYLSFWQYCLNTAVYFWVLALVLMIDEHTILETDILWIRGFLLVNSLVLLIPKKLLCFNLHSPYLFMFNLSLESKMFCLRSRLQVGSNLMSFGPALNTLLISFISWFLMELQALFFTFAHLLILLSFWNSLPMLFALWL